MPVLFVLEGIGSEDLGKIFDKGFGAVDFRLEKRQGLRVIVNVVLDEHRIHVALGIRVKTVIDVLGHRGRNQVIINGVAVGPFVAQFVAGDGVTCFSSPLEPALSEIAHGNPNVHGIDFVVPRLFGRATIRVGAVRLAQGPGNAVAPGGRLVRGDAFADRRRAWRWVMPVLQISALKSLPTGKAAANAHSLYVTFTVTGTNAPSTLTLSSVSEDAAQTQICPWGTGHFRVGGHLASMYTKVFRMARLAGGGVCRTECRSPFLFQFTDWIF